MKKVNKDNELLRQLLQLSVDKNHFNPFKIAFKISIFYFIIGVIWIFFSDKFTAFFMKDIEAVILFSIYKGWVFVFISSALIFYLVYLYMKHIELSHKKIEKSLNESKKISEELISYQNKLYQLAFHDELTGLFNRAMLYEDLKNTINNNPGIKQALILIDMDNFKIINDTMGHIYGDKMIAQAGERLSEIIPKTYTVYRLGGDEFIVYIKDYGNETEIELFADKIINSFRNVFDLNNSKIQCTVSVGIALFPADAIYPDDLLKYADVAMFKAKELGRNNYIFYNKEMHEAVNHRMLLGNYLTTALENNEFEVYYQPQLDIITNKITGFEALLRWNNQFLGSVPPDEFIGVAEETRLIISIGEWVLKKSCIFLKKIQELGHKNLTISVNISVLQLYQRNFVDRVLEILKSVDLNPGCLELEITESILIESYSEIASKLIELRDYGIKIAMDDFGKGYSSLSGLKYMPVNTLKIDKVFIDSIGFSENEESITESIVSMGRRMGMTVLAEGVETNGQLEFLSKFKCHKIQGYIISKPIPYNDVIKLLRKWG